MGIAIETLTTQPDPNDLGQLCLLFHFDLATVALRLRLRTKGKKHVHAARREWDGWAVSLWGKKELHKQTCHTTPSRSQRNLLMFLNRKQSVT